MKILTPLNDIKNISMLSASGADEFYVGFYDLEWEEKYGEYSDLNRMSSFGKKANQYSISELRDVIQKAHEVDAKIYVTLNSAYYSIEQQQDIARYCAVLVSYKADGVIVSSRKIAMIALDNGLSAIGSTMCNIRNHDIANSYREIGVQRIILPRDLSLSEIESVINNCPGIEAEVFFMRSGCKFSDANCLGFHKANYGAICQNIGRCEYDFCGVDDFMEIQKRSFNEAIYNTLFQDSACAQCALFRLLNIGVSALKIVGRAIGVEGICSDVALTRSNLALARECSSEKEYLERMKFPKDKLICMMGKSCYYPEVRF